jgi:hypothetical protein
LNAKNFLHWFDNSGSLRQRYPIGHIQEEAEVRQALPQKLPPMQSFAKIVYQQWLKEVFVRQNLQEQY